MKAITSSSNDVADELLLSAPWRLATWDRHKVVAQLPDGSCVTVATFERTMDAAFAVALVNAHRGV